MTEAQSAKRRHMQLCAYSLEAPPSPGSLRATQAL
jgi:hypothetical protein